MKDTLHKLLWGYLSTVTIAHKDQPNEPHKQVIFKSSIPEIVEEILKIIHEEDK